MPDTEPLWQFDHPYYCSEATWYRHRMSFFVAPDGSKEGWPQSDEGDQQRQHFVDWLEEVNLFVDWVEVRFGGDDRELTAVERYGGYMERDE